MEKNYIKKDALSVHQENMQIYRLRHVFYVRLENILYSVVWLFVTPVNQANSLISKVQVALVRTAKLENTIMVKVQVVVLVVYPENSQANLVQAKNVKIVFLENIPNKFLPVFVLTALLENIQI